MRRVPSAFVVTCVLIAGVSRLIAQSNPHGQLPVTQFNQPLLMLLHDPLVHDDLKLDNRQRSALQNLTDSLDLEIWPMRGQEAAQARQTMAELIQRAERGLRDVLSAEQLKRLREIETRTLGMKAFGLDRVTQSLELADDQRSRIHAVREETAKTIQELAKQARSGGDVKALEQRAYEARVDEQKRVFAVLSQAQQQQWFALLGRRIDLSQLGRVRLKAPPLDGDDGWLNTAALSPKDLRGKVIVLHFFAFA